jgi:hypothetical protein
VHASRSFRRPLLVALLAAVLAVVAVLSLRTLSSASGATTAVGPQAGPVATAAANLPASASATAPAVTARAVPSTSAPATATRTGTATAGKSGKAGEAGKAGKAVTAGKPPAAGAAKVAARSGNDRRVTFVNRTSHTIWVAGWQQTAKPALSRTGWVLPAGQQVGIVVPDKWNGRFWGRTGCTFDSAGKGHCVTGDCDGEFQCHGYGSLPATLAEYNLNAWSGLDFYDVSMVDGSNLPMWINHTGGTKDAISANGCATSGCTTAVKCPAALRVTGGACLSPCAKIGGDAYCCQGSWAPRSACDPTKWPVDYAKVFKTAEPFAYSYVDDDATSTFTCTGRCDYRITFGLTP